VAAVVVVVVVVVGTTHEESKFVLFPVGIPLSPSPSGAARNALHGAG
jgi:hypothetical protein